MLDFTLASSLMNIVNIIMQMLTMFIREGANVKSSDLISGLLGALIIIIGIIINYYTN